MDTKTGVDALARAATGDASHEHCLNVEEESLATLGALSQHTRLAIFRLLVCTEPEGMWVGAIANGFGAPQNTISAHLSVLQRSRLVKSERRGRLVYYRVDLSGMQSLFEYLVADCCRGDASLCAPMFARIGKSQCVDAPGTTGKSLGGTSSSSTKESFA